MKGKKALKPIVKKVVTTTVTPQGRTERELTGEELEEWKRKHGYLEDKDDSTGIQS